MTATITLKSECLILRPIEREDIPQLFLLMSDKKIQDMVKQPGQVYDLSWMEAYIERLFNKKENNHFTWGIVLQSTQQLIGGLSLSINMQQHHAEIGYWIGKGYRNHGYTTEAVKTLINDSFDRYDLHRIYAYTYSYNKASIKILEKVGMRFEGAMRDHFFLDGNYWHMLVYGSLADD